MKKMIVNVLSYLLIFLLLAYLVVTFFIPEQSMKIFGFRTFVVVSTSMEPDINKNDMIVITNTSEEKLQERDAITFSVYIPEVQGYSYVTHYIGEITDDGSGTTIYKTQGATKAEGDYDEWTDENGDPIDITIDDIEGEYLFRIPYIGFLINGLTDPIFVGLLVANGVIIYFIIKLLKPQKKEDEDKKEKEIE